MFTTAHINMVREVSLMINEIATYEIVWKQRKMIQKSVMTGESFFIQMRLSKYFISLRWCKVPPYKIN